MSSRPLARWIGLYQNSREDIIGGAGKFPSPLEVNRFISDYKNLYEILLMGFRPLTRWIGVYRLKAEMNSSVYQLPSPLEVNRFISRKEGN